MEYFAAVLILNTLADMKTRDMISVEKHYVNTLRRVLKSDTNLITSCYSVRFSSFYLYQPWPKLLAQQIAPLRLFFCHILYVTYVNSHQCRKENGTKHLANTLIAVNSCIQLTPLALDIVNKLWINDQQHHGTCFILKYRRDFCEWY